MELPPKNRKRVFLVCGYIQSRLTHACAIPGGSLKIYSLLAFSIRLHKFLYSCKCMAHSQWVPKALAMGPKSPCHHRGVRLIFLLSNICWWQRLPLEKHSLETNTKLPIKITTHSMCIYTLYIRLHMNYGDCILPNPKSAKNLTFVLGNVVWPALVR